jgi:hypothetical protein
MRPYYEAHSFAQCFKIREKLWTRTLKCKSLETSYRKADKICATTAAYCTKPVVNILQADLICNTKPFRSMSSTFLLLCGPNRCLCSAQAVSIHRYFVAFHSSSAFSRSL